MYVENTNVGHEPVGKDERYAIPAQMHSLGPAEHFRKQCRRIADTVYGWRSLAWHLKSQAPAPGTTRRDHHATCGKQINIASSLVLK